MGEKIKKDIKRKDRAVKALDNKKQRARHYWNVCCFWLFLVLLCAFLLCAGREYELQEPVTHGHALWFLLLFSYPVIGIISLFNILLGIHNTELIRYFTTVNPVLGLGLLNAVWLLVLWLTIRQWGIRLFGVGGMLIAGNFALIMAGWGVLQIILSGMMFLWNNGGLVPFHPPEKAPSAIVAKADGSKP